MVKDGKRTEGGFPPSLGVEEGGRVLVDSGFGSVEAIAERTDDLKAAVITLTFGWGDPWDDRGVRGKGCNVQRLIPDDVRYDPVTGLAQMSAVPVNVSVPDDARG